MEIQIFEATTFTGSFPVVATAEWVDTDLLHEGDDSPFYVTLRIAEFPRVSENGLMYDEALVNAIKDQLRGRTGIRGHIPQGQEASAYPLGEAYWVGAELIGNVLFAKAYIPPGATREDMRRRKAIGGGVGTSIYGLAEQELNDDGTWYAREFILQQIDFTEPERAALNMGGEFIITAESKQDNFVSNEPQEILTQMADEPKTITLQDIPDDLKAQIIQESKQATLLSEATKRADRAEKLIKEMGDITATVKLNVPDGADTLERITAMTELLAGLQAAFGQDVSIEMMTNMQAQNEALNTELDAMDAEAFETDMEKEVGAMFETWQLTSDKAKAAVATIKRQFKRAVTQETASKRDGNGKRDRSALKAAVTALWESDFKALAEATRDSLTGGRAYTGTAETSRNQPRLASPEEIAAARRRTGI